MHAEFLGLNTPRRHYPRTTAFDWCRLERSITVRPPYSDDAYRY